jgi:6-phosphogluconolactonase (cycloisomerase 2 family)
MAKGVKGGWGSPNEARCGMWMRTAARLAPICVSLAIMAAIAGACGRSLYSTANSSPTATATGTPGTGAFLFSTNFGDGTVSQFKRSQNTGALTANGTAKAGATGSNGGPFGLTANGNFLYVANTLDGVHQFKIDQSSGKLSPIGGNGGLVKTGNGPQWVAISSGGSNGAFAYVMNSSGGSISRYIVQSGGTLKSNGTTTSPLLRSPYAAIATSTFLYVTDSANGTVVSFPINSDGTLGTPTPASTNSSGTPSPGPIVIDPSGQFVYVGDLQNGFVSQLDVVSSGLQFVAIYLGPSTASPVAGLAIAQPSTGSGNFFLYASNQTPGTLSFYLGSSLDGSLATLATAATGLSGPTGINIDGTNSFLYVANSTANSITQFAISASTGVLSNPIASQTGSVPQYIAIP